MTARMSASLVGWHQLQMSAMLGKRGMLAGGNDGSWRSPISMHCTDCLTTTSIHKVRVPSSFAILLGCSL